MKAKLILSHQNSSITQPCVTLHYIPENITLHIADLVSLSQSHQTTTATMSCPECFMGAIMTGYTPKGTMSTVHTLKTYTARPEGQSKGIIVIIPDAFGQPFPNNKHLADQYASNGYLTYLPDFMNGNEAPAWMANLFPQVLSTKTWWDIICKPYQVAWALYGFVPFILRCSFGKTMPIVKDFLEAVRGEYPNLPIGVSGFCWGGQHTITLAHGLRSKSGKLYSDAHFTAHPSNVVMPDDLKKVTQPLSIAEATEDFMFTVKLANEAEAILKEKAQKEGLKHSEVIYYEGAGHGFGVRADPTNEKVSKHADDSIKQAIDFFGRVFAEWKPS